MKFFSIFLGTSVQQVPIQISSASFLYELSTCSKNEAVFFLLILKQVVILFNAKYSDILDVREINAEFDRVDYRVNFNYSKL